MADTRTLKLSLLADVKKFLDGMDKAENKTKKFDTNVAKSSKNISKSFAAVGIAAGAMAAKIGMDSVKAASDLNEELSKSNVIFGKNAAAIQAFAQNADSALGLSQKEALNAASTFATLGKSAGLTGADLTAFSQKSVTLAADLGSFYNTSPEDAITAIGSALRGEAEPIRRYGVLLSAAALDQGALNYEARTGIPLERDKKNQLTETSKVLARYEIIMAQTTDAQGDFSRTSEGLAGQQKILKAEMTNLKAELGTKLLPVMVNVTNAAIDMINAFGGKDRDGLSERARELQGDLGNTGAASLGGSLKALADSFGNLFSALSGGKSGVDVLTMLANGLESVANAIDSVAGAVRSAKSVGGKLIDTIMIGEGKAGYASGLPSLPNTFRKNQTGNVPAMAAGGSVMGGQAYKVGEFGPEYFVPAGSGSIRSGSTGGGGNTFIFNGVVDAASARRSIERVLQTQSRVSGPINLAGAMP
jgi:hypothetical protein